MKFYALALLGSAIALATPKSSHVRVFKNDRVLHLLDEKGKLIKAYRISLGDEPRGPKICEGDERTPEGEYRLAWINEKSAYHRSVYIDYPREKDRAAAKKAGCPPGGNIFLHGLPNGTAWTGKLHQLKDWTDGCIAVTNSEIDEIISRLKLPARLEVNP